MKVMKSAARKITRWECCIEYGSCDFYKETKEGECTFRNKSWGCTNNEARINEETIEIDDNGAPG